jgi:hypothetical protein
MSEMKREESRKSITRGPILEAAMGTKDLVGPSRNLVGTKCGIESPVPHVTSILETEIDSLSWRNLFHGGIDSTRGINA